MASRKPKAKTRPKAGHPAGSAELRRKLFIEALLSNGENVTEAALAAGFSPKSAASQGSRLLKNVKVRQELDSRREQVLDKAKITTERIMENLGQALFFDPRKLYREDGSLKTVPELDADTAMALSSFEVMEEFGSSPANDEQESQAHGGSLKRRTRELIGYSKKIKWLDKNVARDQASKIRGLYKKDNEQPNAALADAVLKTGLAPVLAKFAQVLGR